MADLFSSDNTQDPNLFSSTDNSKPETTPPVIAPEAVNRNALLASVASTPLQSPEDFLNQMSETNAHLQQAIATFGDENIRMGIAQQQQTQQFHSALAFSQETPSPDYGKVNDTVNAVDQIQKEDLQRRSSYALEKEAFDKIHDLAGSNPIQAKILLDNLDRGGSTQVISDINTKYMILSDELNKMRISAEDQPWYTHVAHFVTGLLPLRNSWADVGNVELDKAQKNWYDILLSGQRVNRENASLWDMPVGDFRSYVRDKLIPSVQKSATFGPWTDKDNELRILTSFVHTPTAIAQNLSDVLDNAALIPVTKVSKLASLPYMLVRAGGREAAINLSVKAALETTLDGAAAAESKSGLKTGELIDEMLPAAVNPAGGTARAGLSGDINDIIAKASDVNERFGLRQPGTLKTSEIEAMQNEVRDATKELPYIKDVDVQTQELAGGLKTQYLDMTIGKEGSVGYATKEPLMNWLRERGLGTSEIFQDESGQWFGKVRADIPETGFYVDALNPQANNLISRWVLSARRVGDEWVQSLATVSTNNKATLVKKLTNTFNDTFNGLRKDEASRVAGAMAWQERSSKWLSRDEANILFNRAYQRSITDKEWKALEAGKDISDIEHVLRNDDLYKSAVIKGERTVTVNTPHVTEGAERANALVDEKQPTIGSNEKLFDVSEGKYIDGRRGDVIPDNRVKVNFKQPVKLINGDVVKSVVGHKSDFTFEALRRDQLNYLPGGHRIYDTKYFLKQAVKGSLEDGTSYLQNPNVYATGKTAAQMKFLADRLETARGIYNETGSLTDIEAALGGHPGLPDAEKFVRMMEDGSYMKDTPFEALYDREMPTEYSKNSVGVNYADPEETGMQGWLRTTGRLYYGRKGETLPDWRGDLAPLLDPYKSISQALENVASLTSWSDYKNTTVQRWADTFTDYIDKSSLPRNASASTILNEGRWIKGNGGLNIQRIVAQGEAQRDIIKRNVGWVTESQLKFRQIRRNFIEWVGGNEPGSVRDKAAETLTDWATNTHPIQALRGLAFDSKLGLFNVGQFFLQTQTMAAALTLSPKFGFQGMVNGMFLRGFLTKAGTERYLDELVERGVWKHSGFENPEEYKAYMQSAKQSGFFDIGGTHTLGNYLGSDVAQGDFMNAQRKFRSAGRFFFNEGEIWNRALGWHIAWNETKAAEKGWSLTDDFLNRVSQRADDYTLNMTSASEAYWQKGLLGIPTQFWAYNARMMEAMLGGNFTRAQRVRLILGQTVLYGSAGVPVVGAISDYVKGKTGVAPDLNSIGGLADRGLLDEMMYQATGSDLALGRRVGTGNWTTDAIKEIFNWGQYGDKSVADMAGGATLGILGQTGVDMWNVGRYVISESGGDNGYPLSKDALVRLAGNVSTIGNLTKASMIFNYGVLKSSRGTVLETDVPTVDAFAMALGFSPSTESMTAASQYNKNRDQQVLDATKVILNYRQEYINEPDRTEEITREVNAFTKLLDPDIRIEALKRANKSFDASMYDKLSRRMEQNKMKKEVINELTKDEE